MTILDMLLITPESKLFPPEEGIISPTLPTLTNIELPLPSLLHQSTTSSHHHFKSMQATEIAEFHREIDKRTQKLELQAKQSQEILVSMSSKIDMILYTLSSSPTQNNSVHLASFPDIPRISPGAKADPGVKANPGAVKTYLDAAHSKNPRSVKYKKPAQLPKSSPCSSTASKPNREASSSKSPPSASNSHSKQILFNLFTFLKGSCQKRGREIYGQADRKG